MKTQELVKLWFEIWTKGNFEDLPLAEEFSHTSPYGTVNGKRAYMDLILANKNQFLGNRFIIHDLIIENEKACIRYTMQAPSFSMEVSEWQYKENGLIKEIVAYYNIEGEIKEDRKLVDMD